MLAHLLILIFLVSLPIDGVLSYPSLEGQGKVCPFSSHLTNSAKPGEVQECTHFETENVKDDNNAPEVTNKGCTCKTTCGATVTTGLANCDWCYTENNCGRSGLTGSWDYCNFLLNTTYEANTAEWKYNYISNKLFADSTPGSYPSVTGIFAESVQTSFGNQRDWMPAGRKKYIHSIGVVCPTRFTVSPLSNYTGLFAANETSIGFVRLGPAVGVTNTSGIIPGLGIKFFRSGVPSGNFVALHTLDPLPDNNYNFFNFSFSNHVAPPSSTAAKLLEPKFSQASECPLQVGLSDFASFNSAGEAVPSKLLNFPFRVDLTSHQFQISSTPCSQEELLNRIQVIPVGTDLFTVTAYADPKSFDQNESTYLGTMKTTGPCKTSAYGDSSFFIQHQGIENDWQLRPEWLSQLDPQANCAISKISLPGPPFCESL